MYITASYMWGYGSVSGRRPTNEDAHIVTDLKGVRNDITESITFAAVYDGHGGPEASSYCGDRLHVQLARHRSFPGDIKEALKYAFTNTDKLYIRQEGSADLFSSAGTTACVMLLYRSVFYVANAGDSRCIVGLTSGKAKQLTTDHKPNIPSERARIERAGSCVVEEEGDCSRVAGMLAVSRAIGDNPFKSCGVISDPDVFTIEEKSVDFLVLACDGLWDVMSNDEVDYCIRHCFAVAHKFVGKGGRAADAETTADFRAQSIKAASTVTSTTSRRDKLLLTIDLFMCSNSETDEYCKAGTRVAESMSPRVQELAEFAAHFPGFSSCDDSAAASEASLSYRNPALKVSPEAIAMYLIRLAILLGSEDNITCIVGITRRMFPEGVCKDYESAILAH